ncbi:MAG: MerR family transcriptional regulator [Acidimicrobiia bacterium]
MSDRDYLSIGEVLGLLQDEFPDVTISKIRFLESQGLIDPERTASGYRKFYDIDIERLRWILRAQKDDYLPLKVIKDRLTGSNDDSVPPEASVAAGIASSEPASAPTSASTIPDPQPIESSGETRLPIWMTQRAESERVVSASTSMSMTAEELANAAGLSVGALTELVRYGLLAGRTVGNTIYYDEEALVAARAAAGFARHGIEPRHLKMYRNAAEREAGLFEQVVLPLIKQRNPRARAEARESIDELARLGRDLREAMLRQQLRAYTD